MRLVRQKGVPPRWYFAKDEVIILDKIADRERLRWEKIIEADEDPIAAANYREDLVRFLEVVYAFDDMVNEEDESSYLALRLKEAAFLLKALNSECKHLFEKEHNRRDIDHIDEDRIDPTALRQLRDEFCTTAETVYGDELYRTAYYNRSKGSC